MTNAIRGFSYALVEYVNQMLRLMTTLYLHYNPYERLCQKERTQSNLTGIPCVLAGHTTEPARGMCTIIIHEQSESVKRKGLVVGKQKCPQNSVDLVHRI